VRFYFGTPGWGWIMWGIGYKTIWFFGFSMKKLDNKTDAEHVWNKQ